MIPYQWLEWIERHNVFILLSAIVIVAWLIIVLLRRHSLLLWVLWGSLVLIVTMTLFLLHTPPVAISEHLDTALEVIGATYAEPDLSSVAAIKALLAKGDKPTLVEFYVDYGFS